MNQYVLTRRFDEDPRGIPMVILELFRDGRKLTVTYSPEKDRPKDNFLKEMLAIEALLKKLKK